MISVQHLTKRCGSHVAVDDLSFEVARGEVLGFLPPSRGTVIIDGCELLRKPIEAKRRLGYLPENPPVYPELTVRQ